MHNSLTIAGSLSAPFYRSVKLIRDPLVQGADNLVLGGGTVLAMRWGHRISTDLDYFLNTDNFPQAKAQINDIANHLKGADKSALYDLDISTYHLKFMIDGTAISVFTSPSYTDHKPVQYERKSELPLESTVEILAKKLHGRILSNGEFTQRDFYDLCVACHTDPESYTALWQLTAESDRNAIADELKRWRSSDNIKNAQNSAPLIAPIYTNLADRLWDYSENVIRYNRIPDAIMGALPVQTNDQTQDNSNK